MKKIFFLVTALGLLLSACLPAALQQPEAASPAPVSEADLQLTAAVFVQQTLEAIPTVTTAPSETPVVKTATHTSVPTETSAPSETPAGGTETATSSGSATITATLGSTATDATTTSTVIIPSATPAITGTAHPQFYGTQSPYLPSGSIQLVNKSKVEVYISLQGTTQDGYTTILEYPVNGTIKTNAPAGKYVYVAWVGGNKLIGKFSLGRLDGIVINIYKDRIEIKAQK